jgi:hypothetical protein
MLRAVAAWGMVFGLGLATLVALPGRLPAQDAKVDKDTKAEKATPPETAEEKAEREGRRQCAIAMCSTLHNKTPAEGQVGCSIQKTWRKEVITKILSRGKISWPWGDTRCGSEFTLDRALLVKIMQEPELEAQFDTYNIRCQIENAKDKYEVTAQVRPKITFKQGKATKATLNWGKIEAPTLAKTALWSITAVDNTFGLFQSTAVEDINDFIDNKCMEVKEEWQRK